MRVEVDMLTTVQERVESNHHVAFYYLLSTVPTVGSTLRLTVFSVV
jgi:hypothetical protein